MCGIVGYVGNKAAAPMLLNGLGLLEYRGYDSAGIAVQDGNRLWVKRATGKLHHLSERLGAEAPNGTVGIGHTRWATHGKPSDDNAHPLEADGVAVVHNGIIENYLELKKFLQEQGRVFRSETDSEVLCHLVAHHIKKGDTFFEAVRLTLRQVVGAYAVVFLSTSHPEHLVAARLASPLIIGIGDNENIVASDIPALLPYTNLILTLEEAEMAVVSAHTVLLSNLDGDAISRSPRPVDQSCTAVDRGGYRHFMRKEIFEQPEAIRATLRGRVHAGGELTLDAEQLLASKIDHIVALGMGTSHHAGWLLKHYVEAFAKLSCTVEVASEFRYCDPLIAANTLAVAISQSGETADTLAGAKEAQRRGARVLAICNVLESSLTRMADAYVQTRAGIEIGVASTKAYTTQVAVAYLFAINLARHRGVMNAEDAANKIRQLQVVPELMQGVLNRAGDLGPVARAFAQCRGALFLGRGIGVPLAYEGALKVKELTYIHAEGYAAGEMKHGPIALIDERFFVVVVAPRDHTHEKLVSNVQEVRARGGKVFSIVTVGDKKLSDLSDFTFAIPECSPDVAPFLVALPLQLLAYDVACLLGNDVDQPRNLAKSVTVE